MKTTNTARRKRRSIDSAPKKHLVRVQLDAPTRARLDELSDRYGVAVGTITREAVVAGLKAVSERLRRAARAATRDRGESEHAPAANRVGE